MSADDGTTQESLGVYPVESDVEVRVSPTDIKRLKVEILTSRVSPAAEVERLLRVTGEHVRSSGRIFGHASEVTEGNT